MKLFLSRAYCQARMIYLKMLSLPGLWHIMRHIPGKLGLPRVKTVKNLKTVPFCEAAEDAIDAFFPNISKNERIALKEDIIRSWFKNRMEPDEYFFCCFRTIRDDSERSKFLSRLDKDLTLSSKTNADRKLLGNKYVFYKKFEKFFNRQVLIAPKDGKEKIVSFLSQNKKYIAKPLSGQKGRGIFIREYDGTDEGIKNEALFLVSLEDKHIIEEIIIQDPSMASLNVDSINTIRISSRWNSKGFSLIEAFIRIGRKGRCTDNLSGGGIAAEIDISSGRIKSKGIDNRLHFYDKHPDSGIDLQGFQIPNWQELLDLVKEAHENIKGYPYIAWDFALSKKGWVLVEGNWGYFISQYFGRGAREKFLECFK